MKKTLFTHLFLWCLVFGFAFTTVAQNQPSFNRAPVIQTQPIKSLGQHMDGSTTGYGADGIGNAWYSVDIPGGALTNLGTTSGLHQGGDFDGTGTFYATLSPSTLITVDLATGAETTVAAITGVNSSQTITAMAWNPTNGTMYIGTTDITTSELYTLDLTTGAATLVGTIGQSGLIAMAFNCDGSLYSVDLVTDDLWSIDPTTGVGTPVGPTGFDLNFAQDADFDPATGIMYLSAYNNGTSSGQLRSVDLATGTTTMLMDWGFLEITDFGIEGTCGPPCPVGPPSNPSPADGAVDVDINVGTLSWTNDPGATNIEVFFDGAMIYSGAPVTSATIPQLAYSTTYSWKVNEANDTCMTFGPTWTFTTAADPNLFCAFMDDFEAGTGNWTITNDGGTCVWDVVDITTRSYTMPPEATGFVFAADADLCGSGTTTLTTATLTTPIDATMWQTAWLEFDNDWRTLGTTDEAYVEVSVDGGTTWTTVLSFVGVDQRDSHELVDITSEVALQSFMVRLRTIQPGWDWWWAVDNFAIYLTDPIPVELTSFAASVNNNNVTLNWATASETNNNGFEVQRSFNGGEYSVVGFVDGHGTTTQPQTYAYTDKNLDVGSYTYRLRQVDFDGTAEFSNTVEVDVTAPVEFSLEQNYPNPFNPSTKIKFSLAADSRVTLKIFDVLGQEVTTLINADLSAGVHDINFNAANLNSGVYFYRIEANGVDGTNFTSVKKMILTK